MNNSLGKQEEHQEQGADASESAGAGAFVPVAAGTAACGTPAVTTTAGGARAPGFAQVLLTQWPTAVWALMQVGLPMLAQAAHSFRRTCGAVSAAQPHYAVRPGSQQLARSRHHRRWQRRSRRSDHTQVHRWPMMQASPGVPCGGPGVQFVMHMRGTGRAMAYAGDRACNSSCA